MMWMGTGQNTSEPSGFILPAVSPVRVTTSNTISEIVKGALVIVLVLRKRHIRAFDDLSVYNDCVLQERRY